MPNFVVLVNVINYFIPDISSKFTSQYVSNVATLSSINAMFSSNYEIIYINAYFVVPISRRKEVRLRIYKIF